MSSAAETEFDLGPVSVTPQVVITVLGEMALSIGYLAIGMGIGFAVFVSKAIETACPSAPVMTECSRSLFVLAKQDAKVVIVGGGVLLVFAYAAPMLARTDTESETDD